MIKEKRSKSQNTIGKGDSIRSQKFLSVKTIIPNISMYTTKCIEEIVEVSTIPKTIKNKGAEQT